MKIVCSLSFFILFLSVVAARSPRRFKKYEKHREDSLILLEREVLKACKDASGCHDRKNVRNQTSLMIYASTGNLRCVQELIKKGGAEYVKAKDVMGANTFLYAAFSFDNGTEIVDALIEALGTLGPNEKQAQLDAADIKIGSTALQFAAMEEESGIVESLLRAGADPCLRDYNNDTALALAQRRAALSDIESETIQLLRNAELKHGCNEDKESSKRNLEEELLSACKETGERQQCHDFTNKRNQTSLMAYAEEGNLNCVETLIEKHKGTDYVNAEDDVGMTALLYLATFGFENGREITYALTKAGANVDHQEKKMGNSALMLAAMMAENEVIKALLENGADPCLKSGIDGDTAFGLATRHQSKTALESQTVKILQEAKANGGCTD